MKIEVKNANGTSRFNPPTGYSSWLEYWENMSKKSLSTKEQYSCSCCDQATSKGDFCGAHVQKTNSSSREMYIIPICRRCNGRNNTFRIDEDLLKPTPSRRIFNI